MPRDRDDLEPEDAPTLSNVDPVPQRVDRDTTSRGDDRIDDLIRRRRDHRDTSLKLTIRNVDKLPVGVNGDGPEMVEGGHQRRSEIDGGDDLSRPVGYGHADAQVIQHVATMARGVKRDIDGPWTGGELPDHRLRVDTNHVNPIGTHVRDVGLISMGMHRNAIRDR